MRPFFKHKILLASQSPRRQMLLKESGFDIEVIKLEVDESFSPELRAAEIPEFLAQKKSLAYTEIIADNSLLVTADTVVWLENEVLNKPQDIDEAAAMLRKLSNNKHTVYTAVCVKSADQTKVFSEASEVYFNPLTEEMIAFYLSNYQPLDKAGAYGIQEFIGYIGIQKIVGCYYNVMGFPIARFIKELQSFG